MEREIAKDIKIKQGVRGLCFDVIQLISHGYVETIEEIEKHMEDGTIVNYICSKEPMTYGINDFVYGYDVVNEYFQDHCCDSLVGRENRKYHIANNDKDGLLLILAMSLELL